MCCAVAINCPSGIDVMDDIKAKVSLCNRYVEVTVRHPLLISCPKELHTPWHIKDPLSLPHGHPRIQGFHAFYSQHRCSENDPIFSTSNIKLPFPVDKNIISIKRFGETGGSQIFYIKLRGLEKNDYAGPIVDAYVSLRKK
jgi:hypothetical protein